MTTFIFSRTEMQGTASFLSTKFFDTGVEVDFSIFFKNTIAPAKLSSNGIIAIKGDFKEELNPISVSLHDAEIVEPPINEDSWLSFFTSLLINNGIEAFSFSEHAKYCCISVNLEHHYIHAELSADKLQLLKLEFGRLFLEKPENKRKTSGWTKAVFVNDETCFIKFLQTSWDGENKDIYAAQYSDQSKKMVSTFLSIPLQLGWTELDHRLDKDKFYKASGKATINNQTFENTFALLDIGEQDLPLAFDKINQWVRTKWADSFINNKRRHIDETVVKPINTI